MVVIVGFMMACSDNGDIRGRKRGNEGEGREVRPSNQLQADGGEEGRSFAMGF
jgi:hypothetical protein